jgi:hypothetical protein
MAEFYSKAGINNQIIYILSPKVAIIFLLNIFSYRFQYIL